MSQCSGLIEGLNKTDLSKIAGNQVATDVLYHQMEYIDELFTAACIMSSNRKYAT